MKEKEFWYYFQFITILSIIVLNLIISVSIKITGINYVANTSPFGVRINEFASFLIVVFIIWGILKFNYLYKYNLASVLILSGSLSNFFERIAFGSVRDYINLFIAYINLADIQIWAGLIILNYQIWFVSEKIKKSKNKKVIHSFSDV